MNKIIIYNLLFFLLLLFPPLCSLSQPPAKWEAGVRLSFSSNFRSYTRLFIDPDIENIIIAANNESDVHKRAATFGGDFFYNVTPYVSFGSGIFISEKGFKTRMTPTCRPGPPPNCTSVFLGTLPGAVFYKEKFRYYYTSVPFYLRLQKTIGKKIGLSVMAGVSADFLTFYFISITEYGKSGNSIVNNYTPLNYRAKEYERVIFSSYTDVSLFFPFKETMRIYVGPTFRYSSPFIKKNVSTFTNLYSIGLEARLMKATCLCKKKTDN